MARTVIKDGETRSERLDLEGSDRLRVIGAFSVSDEDETARFTGPTDGARIVNEGTIENRAEEGRAIRFEEETGTTIDAAIVNDGLIRSADDAIQIDNGDLASGVVRVMNGAGGEIRSGEGQAIDFGDAVDEFLGRVVNDGLIASGENDGVKFGGVGQLVNTGRIVGGDAALYSDGADGVSFEDEATGRVVNEGRILGDRHGVDAGEDSDITVTNHEGGVIIGRNGSGVGSDGSATVINHGVITGAFSDSEGSDVHGSEVGEEDGGGPDGINDGDGDGVDVDFEAHIVNYGMIRGTGAGGTGSDGLPNTAEGVAAGGGVIENHHGARIFGADVGILIDDSSQGGAQFDTRIVNDGSIVGGESFAVRLVGDRDDTIVNGGRIVGGGDVAIDFGGGDDRLVLEDGSKIVGLTEGGEGDDTLSYGNLASVAIVDLASGDATGTSGVAGFENVNGSRGDDAISGDDAANRLSGGRGDDALDGRAGDDTLTGGAGDDAFRFTEAPGSGFATIGDFGRGKDVLELSGEAFDLALGKLKAAAFVIGTEAQDRSDRIVYDQSSGALFYDADGSGDGAAVLFAELVDGTELSRADFLIV